MDWVGMCFSFSGMYFVGTKINRAMILFIIGNALWVIFAIYTGAWSVAVLQAVSLSLNCRTLWMKTR